jgi:hypothetical protein
MSRRSSAHARSRKADAKKARRIKRRAARDASWVPDTVLDDVTDNLELADVLEAFDELVTKRGWTFDDENSDERGVAWFYEPSCADNDDYEGPPTTIWIHESDVDSVYLLLVGTSEGYRFEPEAILEHLDVIEAYRLADSAPKFGG